MAKPCGSISTTTTGLGCISCSRSQGETLHVRDVEGRTRVPRSEARAARADELTTLSDDLPPGHCFDRFFRVSKSDIGVTSF